MLKVEMLFFGVLILLVSLGYTMLWYLDANTIISTWLLFVVFIVLTCTIGVAIFHAMIVFLARQMAPDIPMDDIKDVMLAMKSLYYGEKKLKKWIDSTIDSWPQCILVLNPDCTIKSANHQALSILGQYIVGNAINRVITDESMLNALKRAAQEFTTTNSTVFIGQLRYNVLINVHTWDGEVQSITLIMSVPGQHNTNETGYDRDIVHEIRTPVTAIINAVEILKQDGSDPKVFNGFLPIIEAQSKRLYVIAKNIKTRQSV
jgi:hypothetical protein